MKSLPLFLLVKIDFALNKYLQLPKQLGTTINSIIDLNNVINRIPGFALYKDISFIYFGVS